jgi:WD40 repeat protein/serine/threonine protein kinase
MAINLIGTSIGRYTLESELGSSDIVRVFKAFDAKLNRYVTLKIVTRSKEYSQNFNDYFLREARTLAQLSHPNIVKVLDFGRDQGYLYLVLEHTTGMTLAEKMRGAVEWRSAVDLLLPITQALAYAHERGVIHRDIKPGNIYINPDGQPILSDFSVARIVEDEETRDVTGTNAGLGSPTYMSPEQGKGMPVDYRADIYSLGVIFFEMVTGKPPFTAENDMEVLIQQVITPPPSPRKFVPDLPASVERIILTTLKKDPDERFQSVEELMSALELVRKGKEFWKTPAKRTQKRRQLWPIYVTALLLMAALGGFAWWRSQQIRAVPAPEVQTPTQEEQQATATELPEATPEPTMTPQPTQTSIPPTATAASSASLRQFPAMPQKPGQALFPLTAKIERANIAEIQEVARFGMQPISQVVWSNDNSSIIAGNSDGLYFYAPDSLELQGFFPVKGWITTLAMSNDGNLIAVGERSGQIHILDANHGQVLGTLSGHNLRVTSLAFSPDDTRLVSGSLDKTVRVWDLKTYAEKYAIKKHSLEVNAVLYSHDGNWIASGSNDFHVITWNADTGKEILDTRFDKQVTELALTKDNSTMAVGLGDTTVHLWSVEAKKDIRVLQDPTQVSKVTALAFSPNNSFVASSGEDGIVRVWNMSSGDKLWSLKAVDTAGRSLLPSDTLIDLAFSKDGTRLISLTQGGLLKNWDMADQQAKISLDRVTGVVRAVRFSPDSKILLADFGNKRVDYWNLPKLSLVNTFEALIPPGSIVSPDNASVVLFFQDNLAIFNLNGLKQTAPSVLYNFPPNGWVSYLPDGKFILASGFRSIVLWATATGYEVSPETYRYDGNCQSAYSKDGKFYAAGSTFGIILNESSSHIICKTAKNPRYISSDISSDGAQLAQGLQFQSVDILSGVENAAVETIKDVVVGKVHDVAFSPDGSLLAATGDDGVIVIIDLKSKTVIAKLDHPTDVVNDLAFSPDGKMLAAGSSDGTVEIWGIPAK